MRLRRILVEVYRKIEYVATYIILIVIIALELITRVYPSEVIREVLSEIDLLLVVLVVLLLIFRHMDERFRLLEGVAGAKSHERFSDAISTIFEPGMQVRSIDIVCSSSYLFQPSLESRGVRARSVRILMKNPELQSYVTPSDPNYQTTLKESIRQMQTKWLEYGEKGYIESLRIKHLKLEPLFYGMIVDGKKGFIGFFLPSAKFVETMTNFVISDRTQFERRLLADFQKWFDVVFKKFSSDPHLRKVEKSG